MPPSSTTLPATSAFWRKLTSRAVWWWETKRSYPIRGQWKCLPPLRADQGPVIFVIMTTPGTFDDALWCAWSWLRFLAREVRLAIYIDGPVGTRERQAVETLFPGGTITNARTVISETEDLSSAAEGYFTHHPYGRKLGVLLELQKKEPVFYCDSDVLAFSQPDEIIASIKDGKVGAHIQEEEGTRAYDRLILATAQKLGMTPLPSLNSGLLVIPKQSLSQDLAEALLVGWRGCPTWWSEQTVMACLLKLAPMTSLPRDRYITSVNRQFYWQKDVDYGKIAARHFTTPSRHVMYLKGMPWLKKELERNGGH